MRFRDREPKRGNLKRDRHSELRRGRYLYRRESGCQHIDHHERDRDGSAKSDREGVQPEQGAVLEKIGAEVVYPERDMALRLGKRLLSNSFIDFVSLCNSVEIRQLQVPESLLGSTVEETQMRRKYRLNIIAIVSGDHTEIEVMPDYRLKQGDIIVVIGKTENIDTFVNII